MSELPEAEDTIVFFDGRLLFEGFHGLADFMRQKNTHDNDQLERKQLELGFHPVISFHDGWMIISSSPDAAAKVLATRKGKADAIAQADSFQKFGLEVTGPVYAVSYTDVGAAVKQAADTIDQIGALAPMFLGMMAANTSPDDLQRNCPF